MNLTKKDLKTIAAMLFCQLGIILMVISLSANFWHDLLIDKLNMRHEIKTAVEEDIKFWKESQKKHKKKKNCKETEIKI